MHASDAHWLIHPDAALRLAAASLAALGLHFPKKSSVFGRPKGAKFAPKELLRFSSLYDSRCMTNAV